MLPFLAETKRGKGKSVLEKAVQGRVQAFGDVGLFWENPGWYAQLFEKLEFFLLGFEVLEIWVSQDEV